MSNGFYIDLNEQKTRVYPITLETPPGSTEIWKTFCAAYKDASYINPTTNTFNNLVLLPKRTKVQPTTASETRLYNYFYTNRTWQDSKYGFEFNNERINLEIVPYRPVINEVYFMIDNSTSPGHLKISGVGLDRVNNSTTTRNIGNSIFRPEQKQSIGYTTAFNQMGTWYARYLIELNVTSTGDVKYMFYTILEGEEYLRSEDINCRKIDNKIYIEFLGAANESYADKVKIEIKWLEYMEIQELANIVFTGNTTSNAYKTIAFINNIDFGPCGAGHNSNIEIYLNTLTNSSAYTYDVYIPLQISYVNGGGYVQLSTIGNEMKVRNPLTQEIMTVQTYSSSPVQWAGTSQNKYFKLTFGTDSNGITTSAHWEWSTSPLYPTNPHTPF